VRSIHTYGSIKLAIGRLFLFGWKIQVCGGTALTSLISKFRQKRIEAAFILPDSLAIPSIDTKKNSLPLLSVFHLPEKAAESLFVWVVSTQPCLEQSLAGGFREVRGLSAQRAVRS
jgi:hypothetical protein